MNDQLDAQLAKAVEKSLQLAEQTGEFVIDQAPDLLREFYMWHTASHILGIVFSIGVFIAIYKLRKLVSKKEEEGGHCDKIGGRYYETDELPFMLYSVIGGVLALSFIIVICFDVVGLVKIIVAPKLYLIEYFLK